jgi:sugar phosphate isomerase/epimerase
MAGSEWTRRAMIKAAAAAAIVPMGRPGWAHAPATTPAPDPWRGLKVGVASYTLRKLPLEQAIAAIQRVDLHYVSIKDFHLPLTSTPEERRSVARRFKEAGITPLSCGNVSMQNDAANIRQAFEYARDTGLPTIVCSPHPDSMPILDSMVKEFDIKLAIHNHGPEDKRFPSPYDVWKAVEKYDPRIGLCIDVGHTARAKVDPAEAIRKCRARLYDLHFKDIASTAPDGKTVEAGRGVLDLGSILKAILEVKFPHLVSFEYEKDENDPLPGLAETVGYTKGLLARMA